MVAAQGWNNSIFAKDSNANLACIALCEVVDLRHDKSSPVHVHGNIYVVEDETLVTTRYFFIYPQGMSSHQSIDADSLHVPEDMYGK